MKDTLYFHFNDEITIHISTEIDLIVFEKGEYYQVLFYDQNKKEMHFLIYPGIAFDVKHFNITHDYLMETIEDNGLQHLLIEDIRFLEKPYKVLEEIENKGEELMNAINNVVKRYK